MIDVEDLSHDDFDADRTQNAAVIRAVTDGLRAYNAAQRPDPNAAPVTLCVRDDGIVRAGLLGRSAWRWLRIDTVWVDESMRAIGLGRRLLESAERIARRRGCIGMHLDTMGFQAPGFYEKLGFERFGEIIDCPDVTSVYFKKLLDAPASKEPAPRQLRELEQ